MAKANTHSRMSLGDRIFDSINVVLLGLLALIIMRTYFQTSIPYELQEAADIDGCSPFGVLIRIILPLSGPILAVIGLYYGVGHWNSYFSALLYDTIPTTTDELLEYFRATAAYDYNENSQADEIALSAGSIDDVMYLFMGSYGLMNRGSSHRDVYVDDDGELQYAYSSERFKEELRCLNRLYTEGLLDPDIFTIDFAQLIAKSSTEDATEMASIKTEQENYMKEWRAYFITGQRDIDADWDEYVAGYDGMNTARYMELYRAAREAMGVE